MEQYLDFLTGLVRASSVIGIVLIYVVSLWTIFDRMTPFDDTEELFRKDNTAYLLQRLGLASAQVVAMLAVIPDFDVSYWLESSAWLALEGLWVMVALIGARWFVDWVILPGIKNLRMLLQGNLAIGFAEAGAYLGIGILLGGSLTGTADNFGLSVASTVVFYLAGLAVVAGVFWLYELATPYKMRLLLADGYPPSGVELAGVFVASAIAIQVGVAGDFGRWGESFIWFVVTSVIAVVVLAAVYGLSLALAKWIWRIPPVQAEIGPTMTVAVFRAATMVLAAIVTASVLGVA